jgi:glycosyltransferase involved in cell wall biosynthesis
MIVILYPQFHGIHGIARYLDAFLSNLPANAPEVMLVTSEGPSTEWKARGVECHCIPVPDNRLGLAIWGLKACRFVKALHRERRVSAVNLHIPPLIPGLFLPAGLPADLPLVLTAHTTYLGMSGRFERNQHFTSPWNPLTLRLKMLMERIIIARADTVVTLTEQGRHELEGYGRTERVEVIPNGVDLAQFTPAQGAQAKDIDVIFCGRIERRKGSRPLVEVCRRLVAAQPRIRIAIVGYGADEAFVWKSLAPLADNVELTGKVCFADMVSYYRRSRLYASTSYYEGLPGTCLEAMAMRLPAVVWDRDFYRHLVIGDLTGRLVTTNDLDGMVAQVLELLGRPELLESMGEAARTVVQDRYDWRRLSARLIDVHERAALAAPLKEVTT